MLYPKICDFDDLLHELKMSKAEFARLTDIHPNTISNWKDSPPKLALLYLNLLIEVRKLGEVK